MRKLTTIFAAALISVAASAQILPSIYVTSSPVQAGLAETGIAADADAFAAGGNASAIGFSEAKLSAAAQYSILQPSMMKETAMGLGAFYKITDKIGVAVIGEKVGYPTYEVVNEDGLKKAAKGEYTPSEMMFGAGLSFKVIDCLSVGASVRSASAALSTDYTAKVLAFDVSATYNTDAFDAALQIGNIAAKAGAKLDIIEGLSAFAAAEVLMQYDGFGAGAAVQYTLMDMIDIRAGYHYGSGYCTPSHASLGFGFHMFGVNLNAAYLLASETIGGTLCFGLGYSF